MHRRLFTLGAAAVAIGTMQADSRASGEQWNPKARDAAIITIGNARFTVLTPSLVRMEWSPDATFEDRASQAFVNRDLEVPEFKQARTDDGTLTLETAALKLTYTGKGNRFSARNLAIESRRKETPYIWRPGKKDTGNLKGTFRTLDGVSGATSLEPGILSRDGWVVIDDSRSLVFDKLAETIPQADTWPVPRSSHRLETGATGHEETGDTAQKDALDWYFFGYGHDYKLALYDFTRVAGKIPLPPRYAFGLWWSRYWAYSDAELRELVAEFKQHDVPLDVLVIDMDWHLDGWTGYTWNPKYFPDPEGFLRWAHDQGLKVTLNLHPADGVGGHEAAFPQMCEAMGLDPKTTERVPFDCTDPKYVAAYFKYLHHPLEKFGIDFWWMDWQQGPNSKIPGLDPLWMLNWLHWNDMERRAADTGRRPLIFSRWGGLGNHRYQIGFSGDTFCNWTSLAFQPYFTSTAGNVGYAYWSHDIGGHQPGPVDGELYARWIQWGCFSPILRTHTTKNPLAERRIWKFPPEVFDAARKAIYLRYELLPYIYTMARKCHDTGLPLCRPLYYEWPELDEAYTHGGQYMFGDDLLVAPVTEPADLISGLAMVKVWLPPGDWVHWYSGRHYVGPASVPLAVPLDEIPLFARAGSVIATQNSYQRTTHVPEKVSLNVFAGHRGTGEIYDDDGLSQGYQSDRFALTPATYVRSGSQAVFELGHPEGDKAVVKKREWRVSLNAAQPARKVEIDGKPFPHFAQLTFDERPGWSSSLVDMSTFVDRFDGRRVEMTLAQDERGEQLIAAGMKGTVESIRRTQKLLDARADDLGDKAIFLPLHAAEDAIRNLNPDAPRWGEQLEDIVKRIPRILKKLLQSDYEPSLKDAMFARVFGLFHQLRISRAPDGSACEVCAEVGGLAPAEALKRLGVSVDVHIDPHMSLDTKPGDDDSPAGRLLARRWTFRPTDATRQCVLTSEMIVTHGSDKFVHHRRYVLFPSICAWHIAGPFDAAPMETSLAKKFPPEDGVDLSAEYDGKDGKKISWRTIQREIKPGDDLTQEFFIDFDDVFGERVYNAVVYAFTYLDADEDTDAVLAIGSDDGVVAWLNGKEFHRVDRGRPYTSKQDRVPVRLSKGENTLLLKINQGGGDWGFCVHVDTPDGRPHLGVRPRVARETSKSQNVKTSKP